MVDEDRLQMQIRKFLKEVGVTSQREIERAVAEHETGDSTPARTIPAVMTLRIPELGLEHVVEGTLELSPGSSGAN